MTKAEKQAYLDKEPIAVEIDNAARPIMIYEIIYGINDYAVIQGRTRNIRKVLLHYNTKGVYFEYINRRYYLDRFVRV